jgi:hypothetical protein
VIVDHPRSDDGGTTVNPEPLMMAYAQMRVRDELAAAERRSRFPRPPRPPSRTRRLTARVLVRLAARLSDETVTAVPRRA